jgi:hypothetical protein
VDAYSSVNFPIGPGGTFLFDMVQAVSGITANLFSFTINTAGTYVVSFTGAAQGPVQLRVNTVGVGPQVNPTSFSRILTLNAGDVIDVVNAGSTFEHDDTGTGITIMRIA